MDVERVALMLYFRRKQIFEKKKNKRMWTHPFVSSRYLSRVFVTLYDDLRKYPNKFFNYVRMSISSFDELLDLCKNDLTRQDTVLRTSIRPEEKLFVTLRYLGSGCSFVELHYYYRLGRSTITTIIRDVCAVICQKLGSCIVLPANENEWKQTALGFETHANFPHCIGAVDGKHIRLNKPANSGTLNYNHKHYFSIVLLAVCDANYNFIFVDVGAYEKSNDSAIIKETSFYNKLTSGSFNIPDPSNISESNATLFPYAFVGDEAFGLQVNLMRPYGGNNLSHEKKIFNYRLSRARRYIECSFGILSNKWKIFHRPLNVHVDLAKSVVKTCCFLHNFVRARDGYSYDDTLQIVGFESEINNSRWFNRGGRTALLTRDMFTDYFVNENVLPWQNKCIR